MILFAAPKVFSREPPPKTFHHTREHKIAAKAAYVKSFLYSFLHFIIKVLYTHNKTCYKK